MLYCSRPPSWLWNCLLFVRTKCFYDLKIFISCFPCIICIYKSSIWVLYHSFWLLYIVQVFILGLKEDSNIGKRIQRRRRVYQMLTVSGSRGCSTNAENSTRRSLCVAIARPSQGGGGVTSVPVATPTPPTPGTPL